jgi:hypothetical protein
MELGGLIGVEEPIANLRGRYWSWESILELEGHC